MTTVRRDPATGKLVRVTETFRDTPLAGAPEPMPGTRRAALKKARTGHERAVEAALLALETEEPDAAVVRRFRGLMPRALRELESHLVRGDLKAIQLVLDRGLERGMLMAKLDVTEADLETLPGVVAVARRIVVMGLTGEAPLVQVGEVLQHLDRYCRLRYVDEVESIKALIAELEDAQKVRDTAAKTTTEQILPNAQLPSWGGLRKGGTTSEET